MFNTVDYRSKRIRSNITLLIGNNRNQIAEYINELCKKNNCNFEVISFATIAQELYGDKKITEKRKGRILEVMQYRLKENIVKGENIFYDINLETTSVRKIFVQNYHQFCHDNRVNCHFTCMYFDDNTGNKQYPNSAEGWNDILLVNEGKIRQIPIHFNVIY